MVAEDFLKKVLILRDTDAEGLSYPDLELTDLVLCRGLCFCAVTMFENNDGCVIFHDLGMGAFFVVPEDNVFLLSGRFSNGSA